MCLWDEVLCKPLSMAAVVIVMRPCIWHAWLPVTGTVLQSSWLKHGVVQQLVRTGYSADQQLTTGDACMV